MANEAKQTWFVATRTVLKGVADMPRTYTVIGGSGSSRLGASRAAGVPFEVEMDDGTKIPLQITDYFNSLGAPYATTGAGHYLFHVEAELHSSASPDMRQVWSGHHVLELTFDRLGALIGRVGQV